MVVGGGVCWGPNVLDLQHKDMNTIRCHEDEPGEEALGYVSDEEEDKVVINVGGQRHETLVKSLAARPNTRLGKLVLRHKKGVKEEYFYDRHPGVFSSVIDYYRSGMYSFWGVSDLAMF